jgi:hypothetical protein
MNKEAPPGSANDFLSDPQSRQNSLVCVARSQATAHQGPGKRSEPLWVHAQNRRRYF